MAQLLVLGPVLPHPLDTVLHQVTIILAWCSRQWFIRSLVTSLLAQMVILPCFELWMAGNSQNAPESRAPTWTRNIDEDWLSGIIAVDDPEALLSTLAAMLGPDRVRMSKLQPAMAEHTETTMTTTG